MRRIVLLLLVLGLTTVLLAALQDTSSQSQGSQSQTQQPSSSTQSTQQSQTGMQQTDTQMSGKVSSDGKTFTNDKDSKSYTVDNPDALKGHEGQPVALVVKVDPQTNTVHVLTISKAEPQ